jgi:hypothetical protein
VTDAAATYTMSASYSSDGNYNSASSTQTNNFSIVDLRVGQCVRHIEVIRSGFAVYRMRLLRVAPGPPFRCRCRARTRERPLVPRWWFSTTRCIWAPTL